MSEENTLEQPQEATKSVLDMVVERKGNEKFKDPEVLAKSVLSADDHIQSLERQLKELREDLSNRMTAEEALKALDAKAEEIASRSFKEPDVTPEPKITTDLDPEKVEAIVSKALEKRSSEEKRRQNMNQANQALANAFGDEAVNMVKSRAAELGMETSRLVDMAGENPNAFMALMGQPAPKRTNQNATSDVNTASDSFNKTEKRNYSYYEKVRKENPGLYFKPSFQRQLQKDMSQMGEDFLT